MERLDRHRVPRPHARVGASLEQEPRRVGMAEEGAEVQRGEAVGRECAAETGIRVEKLAQPLDAAERGRLEDVGLPQSGQQLLRTVTVAGVERLHRLGDLTALRH